MRHKFEILELTIFVEWVHHLTGLVKIKRHQAINMLWVNFILFGVIQFHISQQLVWWWILARCLNKIIRHLYNAYLALKFKLYYFWLDWSRMSSFYVLYSFEFAISTCIVWTALPYVKEAKMIQMPNRFNFCLDFSLLYLALLGL